MKVNYEKSILNLTNSILMHYNVAPLHPTLPNLDEILKRNPNNIILLILDGMGNNYLEKYFQTDILNNHKIDRINSVFPCTTTAAIKTYESGLTPFEHGWLGWTLYFKEKNRYINMLPYRDDITHESINDYDFRDSLNFESIFSKIAKSASYVKQHMVYPDFITNHYCETTYHGYKGFSSLCQILNDIAHNNQSNFVYAYCDNPDLLMHEFGPKSDEVFNFMKEAQLLINDLYKKLTDTDTVVIICADHGQIDISKDLNLYEYKDIIDLLALRPFIESRCTSFAIKAGKKDEFKHLFNQYFGDYYTLFTKDEFLASGLLGYGIMHLKIDDFLLDYVAVAKDCATFRFVDSNFFMKGQHAGFLEEENIVPLIVFDTK